MSINPINSEQKLYEVNASGDIVINSIKNKLIFDFAQTCNTDNNLYLENEEITDFLEMLKYSNDLSGSIDKYKNVENYTEYYENVDQQGNVVSKAFVNNKTDEQLMFVFENRQPVKCYKTDADGTSHEFNFAQNTSVVRKDNQKAVKYKVSASNIRKLKAIANGDLSDNKGANIVETIKDYWDLLF